MANLITLDEYKEAMKLTGYGDDVRLESLVTSVSQLVKTYCNNSFVDHASSAKTELFDITYGESFVHLSESPIIGVTSVSERSNPTDTYTILTNNSDYYIDTKTDSIYRIAGPVDRAFKPGRGSVKVVYTGGYSATPADLKLAVIDLITYYHKDEHKQRQTLSGASIQNQGTSGQAGNVGFPDHIKRVLDMYKNF